MTNRGRGRDVPGASAHQRSRAAQPGREVSRVERIPRGRRVDHRTERDRSDFEEDVVGDDHARVLPIRDHDLSRAHRPERAGDRARSAAVRQTAPVFGRGNGNSFFMGIQSDEE